MWFELPFYRSLSEQVLLFGASKSFIFFNGLVALLFIMYLHFWYILPICLILHFLCIYVSKNDDQFFDCLKFYIRKKNYYCT